MTRKRIAPIHKNLNLMEEIGLQQSEMDNATIRALSPVILKIAGGYIQLPACVVS